MTISNDTLFATVELEAVDQVRLRELQSKELALQQLVEMQQATGERRAQELVEQGRVVWSEIATKYKLDVAHINYTPTPDFTKLRPTLVKLT